MSLLTFVVVFLQHGHGPSAPAEPSQLNGDLEVKKECITLANISTISAEESSMNLPPLDETPQVPATTMGTSLTRGCYRYTVPG